MEISVLAEGFLGANCYLLTSNGHALIVDPAASLNAICDALYADALVLDGILLTHGHFDHLVNLAPLLSRFPVPVYLGEGDRDFPSDGRKNAFTILFGARRTFPNASNHLRDGDTVSCGDEVLHVIATPGHSGGSMCFYDESTHSLITGDTLLSDTVGRTDLYGGSSAAQRDSLRCLAELSKKDPQITIYPGHGTPTSLSSALLAVEYLF